MITGDLTAVPNKEPDILQKMEKVAVKHYLGEILAMKEDKVFDMFHIHVTQAHYIWRFNMSINLAPNAQTFLLITKTVSCLAKWKKTMSSCQNNQQLNCKSNNQYVPWRHTILRNIYKLFELTIQSNCWDYLLCPWGISHLSTPIVRHINYSLQNNMLQLIKLLQPSIPHI